MNLPFGRRLPGAASLPDVVFACGRVRACPQARDDGAAFLDDFASIAHACPKVLLRVVFMCRFGVSPLSASGAMVNYRLFINLAQG